MLVVLLAHETREAEILIGQTGPFPKTAFSFIQGESH